MSNSRDTHHANLLVGTFEEAESYLSSLCAELGFGLLGNPDFFAFRVETFGIDEARQLKTLSARKAFGDRKIFLIVSARLTIEAQNALLKTFEDPSPDTHFFLVAREEGIIVPTLRSRMQALHLQGGAASAAGAADGFLSLSPKDRLAFAAKFVDEERDLPGFLNELLLVLRDREGAVDAVKRVHKLALSVGAASASPRLVLEHLALVL